MIASSVLADQPRVEPQSQDHTIQQHFTAPEPVWALCSNDPLGELLPHLQTAQLNIAWQLPHQQTPPWDNTGENETDTLWELEIRSHTSHDIRQPNLEVRYAGEQFHEPNDPYAGPGLNSTDNPWQTYCTLSLPQPSSEYNGIGEWAHEDFSGQVDCDSSHNNDEDRHLPYEEKEETVRRSLNNQTAVGSTYYW